MEQCFTALHAGDNICPSPLSMQYLTLTACIWW